MDSVDFVPSEGFGDFGDFEKPDTDKLPHFPTESLPPIIGNYAHAVAESLQVSEDMAAVAILGIVSLSVMGSFYIEPKTDWIEPLNLYILITARPSERKTPVLKEVSAPVYEYAKEENERRRPLYDKYLTQKKILENRINDLIGKASKGAKGKEPVINSQNPQNPQNLTFRELYHICKGHFKTKEDMQPGIDELIQRNFIRIERKQTGKSGRPSEIVEVNSEYWIRKAQKNIEAKKRRKEIEVGHAEKRIMDKI